MSLSPPRRHSFRWFVRFGPRPRLVVVIKTQLLVAVNRHDSVQHGDGYPTGITPGLLQGGKDIGRLGIEFPIEHPFATKEGKFLIISIATRTCCIQSRNVTIPFVPTYEGRW